MKLNDPAYEYTDEVIDELEKLIAAEYAQAHNEVTEKLADYMRRFEKKDAKWREWVEQGKRTKKEYIEWRKGQIMVGKRWDELKERLSEDYLKAHETADRLAWERASGVYAENVNYGTYEIETQAQVDTSFSLYNKDSVERLWKSDPEIYPQPGQTTLDAIKAGEIKAWNRHQIQSVMTQGILQGESIPKLAKRLEHVTGGEYAAAIRNARTMMTGIQNAGRMDAFKRANDLGVMNRRVWIATLDNRTRHKHRLLDGQVRDLDEPFEVEGDKIMCPGDPAAPGYLIYNCRCSLGAQIKGFEIDLSDLSLRYHKRMGNMTYEEWKQAKPKYSKKITAQAKTAEAIKGAFIREYRK